MYGKRLVLKDKDGHVIGDSWGNKKSPPVNRGRSRDGTNVDVHEADSRMASIIADKMREVGELTVASDDLPETLTEPPLSRLSQTVNRSLLWAGLVAGGGDCSL